MLPVNPRVPSTAAHRGLSDVFPEHTVKAYQAAIDAGADFIECDGELRLVCMWNGVIELVWWRVLMRVHVL